LPLRGLPSRFQPDFVGSLDATYLCSVKCLAYEASPWMDELLRGREHVVSDCALSFQSFE